VLGDMIFPVFGATLPLFQFPVRSLDQPSEGSRRERYAAVNARGDRLRTVDIIYHACVPVLLCMSFPPRNAVSYSLKQVIMSLLAVLSPQFLP
jgi:hypothetical protein